METTQIFHEIPPSNLRFPVLFTESRGIDFSFQDPTETPFSSPEPVQFLALSPTISSLDHQEVVATANTLDSVIGANTATEATDLFSFELESNGISPDLRNISDSSVLDEDCWFDLIDTSNVSGELNDIQLSPIPQTTSGLEPIQPTMSKLQLIRPTTDLSPSIPCPKPSVVFPTKGKPEHRRARKISPSVRLKLSDIEDFDAEDLELDFSGDRENEGGLSDSDSTGSPHKVDCVTLVRPHAGSITWPKMYLHNEDIINGKPGQRVQLSTEEIKMLRAMGVQMPARFPLNQAQERALRTVRRKIRNKLSAQASRARRQEYVADLEYRVQLSDKENERLRRQVAHLQSDKRDLIAHVRRLRSYIAKFLYKDEKTTLLPLFTRPVRKSNHSMKSATQAATAAAGGTSLLIVTFMILGWTAPVLVSPSKNASSHSMPAAQPNSVFAFFPGRSRSLLESSSPDDITGIAIGKSKITLTEHMYDKDSALQEILDPIAAGQVAKRVSKTKLKEPSMEKHEANDSLFEADSKRRTDSRNFGETVGTPFGNDPSKADEFSVPVGSVSFPSTLDM